MKTEQLHELLLQTLETELGGIAIYQTALRCAVNRELREEWEKYLEQTIQHERVIRSLIEEFELEPETETPGREVVRHLGRSLVRAIEMAKDSGSAEAAQLVATDCVTLAETRDHQNWEMIARCAEHSEGATRKALQAGQAEVEDEQDEHLYHSTGWSRELWIAALGLPAALPPPEGQKDVMIAIGAARARAARRVLL